MTTEQSEIGFELAGSGVVTIDWGDGSEKITLTLTEGVNNTFRRVYLNASIRTITVSGDSITKLNCEFRHLTSLDVSKNTALTKLYCSDNQLTSLDVSKNTALTDLGCSRNQLTSLDVSKNTALTGLGCKGNQLTSLDVSKNTALTALYCSRNQLTGDALDFLFMTLPYAINEGIIYVYVQGNPGTTICNPSIAMAKGWEVIRY